MKIKGFSLFVCLIAVTGAFAQDVDVPVQSGRTELKLKPKTLAEEKTEKVMKLKITTQNLADVKPEAPVKPMANFNTDGSRVLVIIDGKKAPYKDFQDLNPNMIESLTVIKDNSAYISYTAKKSCPALQEFYSKKYDKAFVVVTKKKAPVKK